MGAFGVNTSGALSSIEGLDQLHLIELALGVFELVQWHRGFMGDVVVQAVVHDAKIDAVEIDYLVLLVVHLRRAVDELRAGRPEVRAAARRSVVSATGG